MTKSARTRPDAWYCTANSKRTKEPCQKRAGWGTDHLGAGLCRFHGGNSPGGRKQAQALVARTEVDRLGLSVEVQPHVALLEELWRAAGAVEFLGARVRDLDLDELGRPKSLADDEDAAAGLGDEMFVSPAVWVSLWQAERKTLRDAAAACLSAGVEERRVRVAEQTGTQLGAAIRLAFERLGVLDHPDAPAAMRGALLEVAERAVGDA